MSFPILNTHGLTDAATCATHLNAHAFESFVKKIQMQQLSFDALQKALFLRHDSGVGTVGSDKIYLTCDDALESTLRMADIIAAPATLFVVTDFVGKSNCWHGQPAWVPMENCLNWAQIRELAQRGWTIGAHSCTHPDFYKLDRIRIQNEIERSKKTIEDRLGQACDFFAYPYGHAPVAAQSIVGELNMIGLGTEPGWYNAQSAIHNVPRIDLYDILKISIGMNWLTRPPGGHEIALLNARRKLGGFLKLLRKSA